MHLLRLRGLGGRLSGQNEQNQEFQPRGGSARISGTCS